MDTPVLQGHAALIFEQLTQELATGRFPHGILLAGPQGIGKATLAYALAEKLLGGGYAGRARIAAGSHADLLVVAPLFDEKKEEFAREISAEQTRAISEFMAFTAGESAWRVVIVDGAEAMNATAANAILKILEEPPSNAVIILVAHHASRLLPTIRSRCRMVKVMPLGPDDFRDILREQAPEISSAEADRLGPVSEYSPGVAIELHRQEALEMLSQLEAIFADLPEVAPERILAMADMVASGSQHKNWRMFTRLVLYLIAESARAGGSNFWAEQWGETARQFALTEARHLDYKSVVISFFHSLPDKAVA